MIIWLIGLSGAGKSVIGRELASILKAEHANLVYLDGDVLREVWGDSLGYTAKARQLNAKRISNLCYMLDRQDINVVASVLSIFPKWQDWNRQNFSQYFEVFIDVELGVLKERDTRGLYRKALSGEIRNVVGVDIPFPRPPNPDLVISNSKAMKRPEKLANNIIKVLPQFSKSGGDSLP